MTDLRVLDLFSGIGGFSRGLESAGGFETAAFCEIEPYPRKVLKKHWPGVPIYEDVRDITKERLDKDGLETIDVICGGFPCQDISLAGTGKGLKGERSGLWFEYARIIGEVGPSIVIIENVPALRGRGLVTVLQNLCALGYDAEWHCISASYAGLRQLRDRIWIVAYPQRHSIQGGKTFAQAWGEKSREEQLARLVQSSAWPTVSSAGSCGTGHGVPNGTHRNKAIGNAVSPLLVEMIGHTINDAKIGG